MRFLDAFTRQELCYFTPHCTVRDTHQTKLFSHASRSASGIALGVTVIAKLCFCRYHTTKQLRFIGNKERRWRQKVRRTILEHNFTYPSVFRYSKKGDRIHVGHLSKKN
jgi:hypothetical protein